MPTDAASTETTTPRRNTIVVTIDGLRAAAIGAYGQTGYETPAFDTLAAESVVYDWAYAPTADPADTLRACGAGLNGALVRADLLVSDDSAIVEPLVAAFARVESVDAPSVGEPAAEVADTGQATIWEGFAEALVNGVGARQADAPWFAWLHTRGLRGPWDAPAAMVEAQRDDDDPEIAPCVTPADASHADADSREAEEARFAAACRYAAQAQVLDACLGGWFDVVFGLFEGEPLRIVVAGVRGYALGEHGVIGAADDRVFSELQHTPLLVFDSEAPDQRFTRVRSPVGLEAALAAELSGTSVDADKPVVLRSAAGHAAVRSDDWLLRQPAGDARPELYLKPDDRWEQNDVASLEPGVVDDLTELLAAPSTPR